MTATVKTADEIAEFIKGASPHIKAVKVTAGKVPGTITVKLSLGFWQWLRYGKTYKEGIAEGLNQYAPGTDLFKVEVACKYPLWFAIPFKLWLLLFTLVALLNSLTVMLNGVLWRFYPEKWVELIGGYFDAIQGASVLTGLYGLLFCGIMLYAVSSDFYSEYIKPLFKRFRNGK